MIKLALSEVPVLTFRSVCLAGGSIGLFAVATRQGLRLLPPPGHWGRLLLITVFNITLWNACVVYGIGYMSSGRAALVLMALATAMLPSGSSRALFSKRREPVAK